MSTWLIGLLGLTVAIVTTWVFLLVAVAALYQVALRSERRRLAAPNDPTGASIKPPANDATVPPAPRPVHAVSVAQTMAS